ncbi:MAG: LptA/OstA family protein [Candidatus Binatia bacterium]
MRIGREGAVCAAILFVCASVCSAAAADDAKPAAGAAQPNSLFQSLSLGSNKGPVHIDSDSLELDYKSSNVTYRGHVQVTQGDVTLTSDQLSITYDPSAVKQSKPADPSATPGPKAAAGNDADKIKEIVAEGNVRIKQGTRLAEGRRAVFDQAKQTVVLSDGAVLHDGPNQVAGERVIVYLKEDRSVVESGSNSRVKAVLYPGKDEGKKDDGQKEPAKIDASAAQPTAPLTQAAEPPAAASAKP